MLDPDRGKDALCQAGVKEQYDVVIARKDFQVYGKHDLFVAIADKQGNRESPYFHVTVPTPSTTSSDTPPSSVSPGPTEPPGPQSPRAF